MNNPEGVKRLPSRYFNKITFALKRAKAKIIFQQISAKLSLD